MAKERDGSINIYGSLQAKTEDGYVAYTDGIAHENEDGTKTPLDQLLKDSGGIIDVDKLPQSGWQGTVVPNSGYVDNVYFNTSLSYEEVEQFLENFTSPLNILLQTSDGNQGIAFVKGADNASSIVSLDLSIYYWLNEVAANNVGLTAGWQTFDNPIEINSEVSNLNTSFGSELTVGAENDKITGLFSTTPFIYEETNINDKAIYRLNKEVVLGYEGTTVPNSGTIESIYFNTSLNPDEVQNILNNLSWINASNLGQSGFEFYPVLAYMQGSYPYVLAFKKYTESIDGHSVGDINGAIINFANMDTIQDFYISSSEGWQTFTNPYQINATLLSELSGIPLGTQNNKLSTLISTTEFTANYGNKYTYWIYKDKWVQLIDSDNMPEVEDGLEYIDLGEFELKTTSHGGIPYSYKELDRDTYDKIFAQSNNNNLVIKLKIDIGLGVAFPYQLYPSMSGLIEVNGNEVYYNYYYCISSNEWQDSSFEVISQNQKLFVLSGNTFVQGKYVANLSITRIEPFKADYLYLQSTYVDGQPYIKGTYGNSSQPPTNAIKLDSEPTQYSKNLIDSGGVYEALQNVGGSAIVDVNVLPEEPNSDVIYRIPSTDTYKKGTLLVSNPQTTVNKVYFNNDLTIWQTDDILRKLDYVDFNGLTVCPLFSNAIGTNVLFVVKGNADSYEINHSTNIIAQEFTQIYNTSGGWVEGYNSFDLTETGVVELMGLPIGYDNSKLLNLISMNETFTTEHYDEYYIYNNIWYKLLDNQNKNDIITYIETKCNNLQNGQFADVTITEEQLKLAIESNFCILKIYVGNKPSFFYKVDGRINNLGVSKVSFIGGNNDLEDSQKTSIIYFTSDHLTSTSFSPEEIELAYSVTANSNKPVTSNAVYTALQAKQNKITVTENDDGTVDITIPTE